jgi:hypothetical protein
MHIHRPELRGNSAVKPATDIASPIYPRRYPMRYLSREFAEAE